MGWTDDDRPKKGHWVLIDEGTRRRRRLPGSLGILDSETAAKGEVHRDMTVALVTGAPGKSHTKVVDDRMAERYCANEKLLSVTSGIEDTIDKSSFGTRMRDIVAHHPHGLQREVLDKVKSGVGMWVTVDGQQYRAVEGTTAHKVVVEGSNGRHIERSWDDDGVETAWNTGHHATSWKSAPDALQDNFLTVGGYSPGMLAWFGNELVGVVANKGFEDIRCWSARDARQLDLAPDQLHHYDSGDGELSNIMREFTRALIDGDHTRAKSFLISRQLPSLTDPRVQRPMPKFVPQQRRGKAPTPSIPVPGNESRYDAQAMSKQFDQAEAYYNRQAARYPDQSPPDKMQRSWDLMSWESDDPRTTWDRPNPPEGSGVNFLPIAVGGLIVAFALTR